jgi:hypothetical protein
VLIGQQHPASAALMKITRRALLALEMNGDSRYPCEPLGSRRRANDAMGGNRVCGINFKSHSTVQYTPPERWEPIGQTFSKPGEFRIQDSGCKHLQYSRANGEMFRFMLFLCQTRHLQYSTVKFHIVWMRMGLVVLSNYRVIIEIGLK